MSDMQDDMWDAPPLSPEELQAFRVPGLDEATRQKAVVEVEAAIQAYKMQTPFQCLVYRAKFGVFWAFYKPRLVLGTYLVRAWCYFTGADSRLVSQKVWRLLKI